MTTLPETVRIARLLAERFGLAATVSRGTSPEGDYFDLRPSELPVREGFSVRTFLGWRHVRAELCCESFAGDILGHMSRADSEQHARFSALAKLLSTRGGRVSMAIAGTAFDATNLDPWPETLIPLSLSVERTPLMVDRDDPSSTAEIIGFWGGSLYGMVVSLLPVMVPADEEDLEVHGLPEGAKERVEVNRYERNRINRTLCLAIHGTSCTVCQMDFEKVYGEIGKRFIHVHHVVPVSTIGPGYIINPATDLVPVCPNCHAMLHRRVPPFTIDELRNRIKKYTNTVPEPPLPR